MSDEQLTLLRPAECVDRLKLSRAKVYALLSSGALPSIRFGRSVRVPALALARFIAEHTDGADGLPPSGTAAA